MLIITRDILKQLLKIDVAEKSKTTAAHIQFDQTGDYDSEREEWLEMDQRENVWLHKLTEEKQQDTLPDIYLTNSELNRDLEEIEMAFFAALINETNLYLRTSSEPISKLTPVTFTEFLQNRTQILHCEEQQAEDEITASGKNANNFIKLDWQGYIDILHNIHTLFKSQLDKDTRNFLKHDTGLENDFSAMRLYPAAKKIRMLAPTSSELKMVRQRFPDLHTLEIQGATQCWLDNHLPELTGIAKEVTLLEPPIEEYVIPAKTNLEKLTIDRSNHLKRLQIADGARIKEIEIMVKLDTCQLDHCQQIRALTFHEQLPSELTVRPANDIEILELKNFNPTGISKFRSQEWWKKRNVIANPELFWQKFPHLKKLVFYNNTIPNKLEKHIFKSELPDVISIAAPELTTLEINKCTWPAFDLSQSAKLATATLHNSTITLTAPSTCQVIDIDDDNIKGLNFDSKRGESYALLESAKAITSATLSSNLDAVSFPNLQKITFAEVNFSNFKPSGQVSVTTLQFNKCFAIGNWDCITAYPTVNNLSIVACQPNASVSCLSFPRNESIRHFKLEKSAYTSADLTALINAEDIEINQPTNKLLARFLSNIQFPKKVRKIKATYSGEEILDYSELVQLKTLELNHENLIQLILPSHITQLNLDCPKLMDKKLTNNFEEYSELEFIKLRTEARSVKLTGLKKLRTANLKLKSSDEQSILDLAGCANLTLLTVQFNGALQLNLTECVNLRKLRIQGDCKKLTVIGKESCQKLRFVTMREIKAKYVKEILAQLPITHADCQVAITTASEKKMTPVSAVNNTFNPENSERKMTIASAAKKTFNPEQILLEHKNQNSPVAIFDPEDSESMDDDTAETITPSIAEGQFTCVVYGQGTSKKNEYHIDVHNSVTEDLIITRTRQATDEVKIPQQPINAGKIAELRKLVANDPTLSLVHCAGILEDTKKEPYGLPCSGSISEKNQLVEFYSDPPNVIKISWDEKLEHYFFRSTKPAQPIKMWYLIKNNNAIVNADDKLVVEDPATLLPPKLRARLLKEFKDNPKKYEKLSFLFDNSKTVEEKMTALIAHCSEFKNEKLTVKQSKDPFEIFLAILAEQKGSCRHRVRTAFILGRLIGVPVIRISNESHALLAIPYQTKKGVRLQTKNLGGSILIDHTPQRKDPMKALQVNSADEKRNTNAQEVKDIKLETKKSIPETDLTQTKYLQIYTNNFRQLAKKSLLTSLDPLFIDSRFPPLIELKPEQSPLKVNQLIMEHLRQTKKYDPETQLLYINNPADFKSYLYPWQINGGKRQQIDGPLLNIINTGGVLVVNWENFNEAQIAHYKSILDTKPTLLGRSLAKVTVIGLTQDKESCITFLSRTQPFALEKNLYNSAKATEIKESKTEPLAIDLFNQPTWRKRLFGNIVYKANNENLENEFLLSQIQKNQPIILRNPPKDDDLDLLIHKINNERHFFHNGKAIKIPRGFYIETRFTKLSLKHNKKTIIFETEKKNDLRHRIHLSKHNLHQCLQRTLYQDNQRETIPGLLANFSEEKEVFYISGFISASDWALIQEAIAKLQTQEKKIFRFILAPGAEIEEIENNSGSRVEPIRTANVYMSNDPDYLCQQKREEFKKSAPLIIYVSPLTTAKDLIAEISKNQFIEKEMLTELLKGRTIILNGDISPKLYQQLLPFLTNNEQQAPIKIDLNGKMVELPKETRIVLILPEKTNLNVLPLAGVTKKFSFNDYRDSFADEIDKNNLKKIENFYLLANKLPHRGPGRPPIPMPNRHRLCRMLAALKDKNPLHKNNPLKHLFLYDYPIDSEDYAYLNVVAKVLFSTNQSAVRLSKLRHLKKENYWQRLNCFPSSKIIEILQGSLTEKISFATGFPSLTQEAIAKLEAAATAPADVKNDDRPKNNSKKSLEQFTQILADKNKPIILLKGPPGTGKTRAMHQLKKDNCFAGEAKIIAWLESKSGTLLLDEGNKAKPGMWDFLKGLAEDGRSIYYKGKNYQLTEQHKVIITGNPESYQDRHYHFFLQNYAEIIYFKKPNDTALIEEIFHPMLQPKGLANKIYIDYLLQAYHLIEQYNPAFENSFRNAENLAQRFINLADKLRNDNEIKETLFQACASEFSGAIKNAEQRDKFVAELREKLALAPLVKTNAQLIKLHDLLITPEKKYLVDVISQSLDFRQLAHDDKTQQSASKLGVIIEGDSGLGKSTLFEETLKARGFQRAEYTSQEESKKTLDPHKKYYVVSAGSEDTYHILIKAFHEGSIVILDELNIDKNLEDLLNNLLSHADEQGNPHYQPLFRVFASVNPSNKKHKGLQEMSQALLNRMDFLYMDNFTNQELEHYARAACIQCPEQFVLAFLKLREEFPKSVNMRTFYKMLQDTVAIQQSFATKLRQTVNSSLWNTNSPKGIKIMQNLAANVSDPLGFSVLCREQARIRLANNKPKDPDVFRFYTAVSQGVATEDTNGTDILSAAIPTKTQS